MASHGSARRKELDLRLVQGTSDRPLAFHSRNETKYVTKGYWLATWPKPSDYEFEEAKQLGKPDPVLLNNRRMSSDSVFRVVSYLQRVLTGRGVLLGRVEYPDGSENPVTRNK